MSYGDWSSDVCSSDLSELVPLCTERNEFRFLTSTLVPSFDWPTGRSETFTSQRSWPFSMSASLKIGRASCRERASDSVRMNLENRKQKRQRQILSHDR